MYDLTVSSEFQRDWKEVGVDREGFVSYFSKRLRGNRLISGLDGFFFFNGDQERYSKVIDLIKVSFLLISESLNLSEHSVW